ncbi:hypothetical protein D3C76_877480 [compost metagenome]
MAGSLTPLTSFNSRWGSIDEYCLYSSSGYISSEFSEDWFNRATLLNSFDISSSVPNTQGVYLKSRDLRSPLRVLGSSLSNNALDNTIALTCVHRVCCCEDGYIWLSASLIVPPSALPIHVSDFSILLEAPSCLEIFEKSSN